MEIGQFLNLEIRERGSQKLLKFRSKIIDKDDDFLYVTYPVEEENGKTTYFPVGTHFQVSYFGADENIYQFHTEILNKRIQPIPAVCVAIPEENKLKRIQRRKFARIEIVTDVAVHCADNSFSPFTTVTTDFSGGGLAFIIPKNVDIHKASVVLWLAFELHQDMSYLKITGEIVRITDEGSDSIRTASVAFKNLTRKEEQTIIRYCFEKQRQARRKELS